MSTLLNPKQYKKLEEILKVVNTEYVTVSDEDKSEANPLLKCVLDQVINAMEDVSPLFRELYSSNYYGGSAYSGLKVGKPDEFDLDLKLTLPAILEARLIPTDEHGFVKLQMPGWTRFLKDKALYKRYEHLAKFKDEENYLLYNAVMTWMESIVEKALNSLGRNGHMAEVYFYNKRVCITTQKNGPAITLKISCSNLAMDVDLVASFLFTESEWPKYPFRECDGNLPGDFLLIPKPPKGNIYDKQRYWRLSFQVQEQIMMSGYNFCKPALRLLKKLRDTYNHNIPSYYINTVFLWEIEKQQYNLGFWNNSLSFVFMHMLNVYLDMLDEGEIPYFWNENNNLLINIKSDTIRNIANLLRRMIYDINRHIDNDLFVIADYLLPDDEYYAVKVHFGFTTYEMPEPQAYPVESSSCTIL